jgi:hypothetical protein
MTKVVSVFVRFRAASRYQQQQHGPTDKLVISDYCSRDTIPNLADVFSPSSFLRSPKNTRNLAELRFRFDGRQSS